MTGSRRQPGAGAALLILITFLAFLPALDGEFIWDDDAYVVDNTTLDDLSGLGRIWFEVGATPQYYPVVFTTFWMESQIHDEKQVCGKDPFSFHLVNVCLHLLNAVLFFRVLRALGVPGALVAAALFAVHPVTVESVAWISERKNVLSTLFFLGSVLASLRFFGVDRSGRNGRLLDYSLALLLFLAALLSKSVTASLPAVLLLLIGWRRSRPTMRELLLLLPFFVAGTLMVFMTAWVEAKVVGAERVEMGLSLLDRVAVAGQAVWFYLGKLLAPVDLMFIYPRWDIHAAGSFRLVAPLLAVALLIALYLARRRLGVGPLVAALYFGGTLLPALGLVDFYPMIYSYVADHFQYLAMFGPLALFAALLARLPPRARWLVTGLLLLLLGWQTHERCKVFHSSQELFEDTLRKNPAAAMASINLASIASRQQGDLDRSLTLLRAAEKVDPARVHYSVRAKVQYNIGRNLIDLGDYDGAITYFHAAQETWPNYWNTVYGIGFALARKGDLEGAAAQLRLMLQYHPDHEPSKVLLEHVLQEMK
ncbi:MAG: tetratricopeptide repeat protein [Planctomycetota bacterium]